MTIPNIATFDHGTYRLFKTIGLVKWSFSTSMIFHKVGPYQL